MVLRFRQRSTISREDRKRIKLRTEVRTKIQLFIERIESWLIEDGELDPVGKSFNLHLSQHSFQLLIGQVLPLTLIFVDSLSFDLLKQKRVFIKKSTTDSIVEPVSDDEDDMPNMIRIMGPKERIPMDASLWVDGKIEVPGPPPLLRVYHKPKWVLSVMADPHGRKNLESLSSLHLSGQLHPVGRLDYDTSGLLLFSSEGSLTQALLHPNQEIEKEYVATVVGTVNEEGLSRRLQEGVTTSMGTFPATLVETQPIPRDDVADIINNILQNLPPEYDRTRLKEKGYLFFADAKELSTVRIIVKEGKHRMVRRILANSGYPVISLKRERLGYIQLGGMEEGGYRDLTQEEEGWAQSLLKKKKKKSPPPSKRKKVTEATGKLNGNRE